MLPLVAGHQPTAVTALEPRGAVRPELRGFDRKPLYKPEILLSIPAMANAAASLAERSPLDLEAHPKRHQRTAPILQVVRESVIAVSFPATTECMKI